MAAHPFNIDTSTATAISLARVHELTLDVAAVRRIVGDAVKRVEIAGTTRVIRPRASRRAAAA